MFQRYPISSGGGGGGCRITSLTVSQLPTDVVCNYWQEHVIEEWADLSPEFHNILALQYKDRIMTMMEEYIQSLPEGQQPPKVGYTLIYYTILYSIGLTARAIAIICSTSA